tara:strand:- start:281 stop:739 length:459 start_codon:yes stop_codon:yes gene_type:complete
MYKKILFIIASIFFLQQCGYTPIYSKNINKDLNIELVQFTGDRQINNALKYNLERYSNQNGKAKIFITTITNYTKSAETKNLEGNITSYNATSTVVFKISYGQKESTFQFKEASTIKNKDNQLEEDSYEKSIKQNFAETIANKLILKLLQLK